MTDTQRGGPEGIAIIGMGLRLPGASTAEAFWGNLAGGVEAIRALSDEELRAEGVPAEQLASPGYVKAGSVLDDIAAFDAGLFGVTPREAELMDPQHRLFLECCWEALEHAGHAPAGFPGRIGVFAGASINTYLLRLASAPGFLAQADGFQLLLASDKDFLATRVAYKLDLRGPSLTVQTACSTSLVAVHLACQSLLLGESDLVLAGGASVGVPHHTGYPYTPGGILSPDGHCRPFGAEARGTVPGNGVATVVLRRLEDAVADGDTIYAVILASAINNDGAAKVGYTAPSIDGQAQVIGDALALAGIPADSIGLVEAHGTGTPMGDPIEVAALTQAFRASTDKASFCALGSVKSNLGHLDAAAGVVGLIKAVLALHHQQLPPSLHCLPPHPDIAFATSPFFLSDTLRPWLSAAAPRRAAVSSFGIGGTNAHLILQEAPPPAAAAPSPRAEHLLLLSAHTAQALEQRCDAFSGWAHTHAEAPLADVAFTHQLGRTHLPHRRFLLASSLAQAADALDARHARPVHAAVASQRDAPVVFLFPGQGAQHPGMAAQLYAAEPVFRDLLDHGCALLAPRLGLDLRAVIFPPEGAALDDAAVRLAQTQLAQPALFVVEYCLARLWMHWGIRPAALLGHSIGQYTAACLAGVFSLEDALTLVCLRGALLQPLPPGAMLAVPLPEAELAPLLDASVDLAAVNTPALCVASGPHAAIAALAERLAARGIHTTPLHTSHAFHSHMVEPALPAFTQAVARLALQPPSIPILENLSGQRLSDADATSPAYWARHLRGTVRFSDTLHGVRALADQPVLLEVGPGTSLASLARLHPATASCVALPSLPHPKHPAATPTHLVTLGQLWLHGAAVDWRAFHAAPRRRLPLPSLPFQRQRFWIDLPDALPRASPAPASSAAAVAPDPPPLPPSSHPRPPLASAYAPPRDDLEQLLVAAWEQHFGISPIGIHDNFFELGGHSLLATQLCALLSARLALQVPLSLLFDAPSPARLSAALEALLRGGAHPPPPPPRPGPRTGPLPLCFLQQHRLEQALFHEPTGEPPCIAVTWRIEDTLDVAILSRALDELVRRQDHLRTTFHLVEGRLVPQIASSSRVTLQVEDLQALADPERREAVRQRAWQELERTYDLAGGPLIFLQLMKLGPRDHVLLVSFHQLIGDGSSVGIIADELITHYTAFSHGQPSPLPALPLQYVDIAHWQRAYCQGELFDTSLAWWQRTLRSPVPLFEPPLDQPRPARPTFHGTRHIFRLPATLMDGLRAQAQREGVTLFMLLLAAWSTLLSRFSGQPELLIGSPATSRLLTEHARGLIGLFIQMLALRVDLSGNPSLRGLLQRVRQVTTEAQAHSVLPYDAMVDELLRRGLLPERPPLRVGLVLYAEHEPPVPTAGLTLTPYSVGTPTTHFELSLTLVNEPSGFQAELEYNTDLFAAETIARLARQLDLLLRQMLAHPEWPLDELAPSS